MYVKICLAQNMGQGVGTIVRKTRKSNWVIKSCWRRKKSVVKYRCKYNYSSMGNSLAPLALAAALSVGNTQAEGLKSPDFSGLIESGNPAVTQVVHDTQARIAPLAEETNMLVAQASQETDGKIYTVYVIQVDGSKKEVKYTKDTTGIINPPESGEDGKLLDGSPATSNPKLNRWKNRSILAKYDKESQIMYALVDKSDIIWKAKETIKFIISTTKDWKTITKDQLADWYYSAFILFNIWGDKDNWMLTWLNSIAKVKLWLSNDEIDQIRTIQERKAMETWRLTTWALG